MDFERVYLVVRHQDHAMREITLKASIWQLANLASHALVAAYVYFCGGPPLSHGKDEKRHLPLRPGHVVIVVILVD